MKKVAVILAGCGVYDGAEIYESVLTLLHIEQADAEYQCMAPNIEQMHVLDHRTGDEMPEQRNVLTEAARICRGQIMDLAEANPNDYDALIIPGGFGAAKNLSDFAVQGAECSINADVQAFVHAIHSAGKPVGLVCIAPALAPKLIGQGSQCTIGNDADTAAAISSMGGQHVDCAVEDIVIDHNNKLVTTPAYMLAGRISEASAGIQKLVQQVVAMA
ncbi:isoprenoid biosynthesis protein ElbB [Bacterioplanes sanyensis]|uniref:Glyoxalase n=1 Tax=Bacterioplanes sanyensis TaxID=1249553 RepID=A0A222FJW1_9GAMM|nr:isoprenoid biosynthesis glyoxalase ElbB [Bacterioplanes sanyensis]ASP38701.1 isoprenoid biosynthesis protein ElbB [Bacterioplanes sanyensis]